MARALIIIGGGAEQVPAYEKAKAMGLTVIGTDKSPDAPALKLADYTVLASTRDAEETVAALTVFHDHPDIKIQGVMTIANDVPYTVAAVAKAFSLPGISLEAAHCASNKLVMKQRFQSKNVPCPWFTGIATVEELKSILQAQPQQQFVIKPIDGRGARGVLLIDAASDLDWAFAESRRWGDCGDVMLEAFIPGLQLSTESFLQDGACYTAAYAERNYARLQEFAPYIIEDGGTIPALITPEQQAEIDRVILAGAKAMGIESGIVKGDIVMNAKGQPMIIELAARLSGGWFATHQIPEATGIDLVTAVILNALGEWVPVHNLQPTRTRATAIRYWFPKPGRIKSIMGEADLKKIRELLTYGFFRHTGDLQPEIKSHPDRLGYVIISADTRDNALETVNQALQMIQINTESA